MNSVGEIYQMVIQRLQQMKPEDFIKLGYRIACEYPEAFIELTSDVSAKVNPIRKCEVE